MPVVKLDRGLITQHHGAIAGVPEIVSEKFLDHFAFVAEAKDELRMSVMGIRLHDMPQDGSMPNGYHWLRPELRFFPEPRAFTTAQNYNFHTWDLLPPGLEDRT